MQLRWTDIEIRKYRLGNKVDDDAPIVDDDEELPPLEPGDKSDEDSGKESSPKKNPLPVRKAFKEEECE